MPPVRLVQSFTSAVGYPIQVYQLANGHRVVYENRPADAISMRTYVDAGSIAEDPIQGSTAFYKFTGIPPGLAHLDEHCHFLTTQHYPNKNEWVQVVDHLGVQKNASTSHEVIQHELVFNKEDLIRMIALHGEMVLNPLYKKEDIEQEKSAVIREAQERGRHPGFQIYDRLWMLMFDRPGMQTLGKVSDIQRITPEHLSRFHQQYYTPDKMITVLSGHVDNIPGMLTAMNQAFGLNPPNMASMNNSEQAVRLTLPVNQVKTSSFVHPELTHSIVTLGFPAPSGHQYKDRIAFQFLLSLLVDEPDGILSNTLIQKERLAHDLSIDYAPLKQTGLFTVSLNTSPGQEVMLQQRALQLLSQFAYQPIDPVRVERIRNQMLVGFYKMLQSGENLTAALGNEMIKGNLPYFQQFPQWVKSISAADIQRVAKQYLNPNRYVLVYALPPSHPMAQNADIKALGGAR